MEDLPPNLDEIDELDGYWTEQTTITVSRYTKARLDKQRDEQPWDQYLEKLRRAHADPLTFSDVEQIQEYLSENIEIESEAGSQIALLKQDIVKLDEEIQHLRGKLDDLQSQLPKDVAKEVSQR